MSEHNGHDSSENRKLTLDALFADQPFLSATMKAQLLHQKLREQEELQGPNPGALPAEALIGDVQPRLRMVSDGDAVVEPPQTQAAMVDLQKAAGFLRAGCPPGRLAPETAAKLSAFRRGTLEHWLSKLPEGA